jgi:DNA-binding MarR family transcriptional regulator
VISGVAELAHDLRPLLSRLYHLVRRRTLQLQLTLTQASVLSELLNDGPRRMSALAELEGVRMPSMTDVVKRLERLGLVRRETDPTDGRAVLVRVTEQGKRFHDEVIVAREEFLRERLTGMTHADRDAIEAALPALRRLLDPSSEHEKEELIKGER